VLIIFGHYLVGGRGAYLSFSTPPHHNSIHVKGVSRPRVLEKLRSETSSCITATAQDMDQQQEAFVIVNKDARLIGTFPLSPATTLTMELVGTAGICSFQTASPSRLPTTLRRRFRQPHHYLDLAADPAGPSCRHPRTLEIMPVLSSPRSGPLSCPCGKDATCTATTSPVQPPRHYLNDIYTGEVTMAHILLLPARKLSPFDG